MSEHAQRETKFVTDQEFAAAVQRVGGVQAALLAEISEYISPDIHSDLYEAWVEARRTWASYSIYAQELHEQLEDLLRDGEPAAEPRSLRDIAEEAAFQQIPGDSEEAQHARALYAAGVIDGIQAVRDGNPEVLQHARPASWPTGSRG